MDKEQVIIDNSNKIYSEAVNKYGNSSSAVLWDNQQTQYLRFTHILNHLTLDENISILDVGCGNGEFYKFLNFNGFKGKYTGFDINEDLLAQAKNKYKKIDVKNVDILKQTNLKKYDYVIVSGLFNSNYGQDIQWVYKMVTKLYQLSNKKAIFNGITTYVNFKEETLFYIDPCEMLNFCIKNLTTQVSILHSQLPYNFVCILDKSKPWESI